MPESRYCYVARYPDGDWSAACWESPDPKIAEADALHIATLAKERGLVFTRELHEVGNFEFWRAPPGELS